MTDTTTNTATNGNATGNKSLFDEKLERLLVEGWIMMPDACSSNLYLIYSSL